jgi:flagellar motility protein MotE (MotC chaperone)
MKLIRPPRQARALLFLSVCFAASASVRVGDLGFSAVEGIDTRGYALAQSAPPEPTTHRPEESGDADRDPTLSEQAAACDVEPGPLIMALRERAAAVEAREARIAERERLLEVTEARVQSEIARLEAAESKLAETLAIADGASERDVAHLIGVYEAMKPKNAAAIFDEMQPRFAAGFLARMRADSAAGILAAMAEQQAYAVTAVMAGRHVRALLEVDGDASDNGNAAAAN